MADIELVIKIDEEQYEFIKQSMTMDKIKDYHALLYDICEHIRIGTPLSKGHGRIGDLDALREEISSWGMNDYEPSDFTDAIDRADVIIEADRVRDCENK